MATIKLPNFGILDSTALDKYYDTRIDFNNIEILIDLNFDDTTIDIKRLEAIKHFIENTRIHDINNKRYIQDDFNDKTGKTVSAYIQQHLEELGTDDLAELIGPNTKTADQPKLLLSKLHLIRVGLYPHSKEQFAVFDYSIGKELTDQLVVIDTDENGNIHSINMES